MVVCEGGGGWALLVLDRTVGRGKGVYKSNTKDQDQNQDQDQDQNIIKTRDPDLDHDQRPHPRRNGETDRYDRLDRQVNLTHEGILENQLLDDPGQ